MSEAALAVPETMRAVTKFTAEHAREVGLPSPEAVNYMMSVATLLIDSTLVTADMGNDPKTIKANAMAKMLVGHEMDIQPMAALQDIDIVKNKVFVRYPQLIDQMLKKGFVVGWVERSNVRAAMEVTRPGMAAPELFEFTIEDAQRAGLLGGKPEYNQYLLRPRVMLAARVVSEAYRMTGGRGNVYTPEEKAEIVSNSTTGDPSESDAARMDVINAQYHVGLKKPPNVIDINPDTVKSEPAKPAPPKPAPETVAEPVKTEPIKAEPAPAVAAPIQAPTPASSAGNDANQVMCYEIHSLRTDGSIERMDSEPAQTRADTAKLRAAALCNELKCAIHVMERRSGPGNGSLVEIAKFEPPAPPSPTGAAKSEPSPLKRRLMDIAQSVFTTVNRGLTEDHKNYVTSKTVSARVATFLQGYMGVHKIKDIPLDEYKYADAFPDLESCAVRDPIILMSAPEDTGKRMAADNSLFERYHLGLGWPKELAAASRSLARLRGLNFEDHKLFLIAIGIDKQEHADALASLYLCLATRNAGKFIREVEAHNLSVAATVKIMETDRLKCSLDTATSKAVEAAIDWVMAGIKQVESAATTTQAAKESAKEPVAPVQPAATEEQDNLFDDLP